MRRQKKGKSWTNRPPLCLLLAPKKVILVFVAAEFFKPAWSVCEELSFQANFVTFGD